MAYLVVLEGQHKSGKSTLATQLQEVASKSGDWQQVVNTHHTRGDSTPEKLAEDRGMVADAPDDTLYIFDRHYLSELVYAPVEGRGTTIHFNPSTGAVQGRWIDQRGVRLYLMGEPLHTSESPVIPMYERLTARTGWMRVEPREFIGDTLAKDVLAAVRNKRLQNETWGFPREPEVTASTCRRRTTTTCRPSRRQPDWNAACMSFATRTDTPPRFGRSRAFTTRSSCGCAAELDERLMEPFQTEGEPSLWTL